MNKHEILEAIRSAANSNGSVPLGRERFTKETGIPEYQILKHWRTYGEALIEAGFVPNTLNDGFSLEHLKESLVTLIREIGRIPTRADLLNKRTRDPQFPSANTFERLGRKADMIREISEYAAQNGYSDIVSMCAPDLENAKSKPGVIRHSESVGEVYLLKSGRYYKIGKTNNIVRRGAELRILLPDAMTLIHSIVTDDPSGVEAYWHKRFAAKRKNGEWFDLSATDLRAFKRWRRIY